MIMTSTHQVDVPNHPGHAIVAKWQGGPYVDLYWDHTSGTPFEVLNVWDYEKGACEIPFERDALRGKVSAFIHDPETDLENYYDHTHPCGRWS